MRQSQGREAERPVWLIQHEARQNLQQRDSWGGGDIRKLRAWKSGIHQAGGAPLSMGTLGYHSAAFPGGLQRGMGSIRDQQRSNRRHTGVSSPLIPVLTPLPLLPALIHPLLFGMFQILLSWCSPQPNHSLPDCFIPGLSRAGAASLGIARWSHVPPGSPDITPGAVPRCPAALPAQGGGAAPSVRASASSGRRKVSSPWCDVFMTTGPNIAFPLLTEALWPAGQPAPRRMSVLAAGSTGSSAGHRAQPLPAKPGRNPSSAPPRHWGRE